MVRKDSVVVIEVLMALLRKTEVHGVDRRYVCTGHSTCV